MVKLKYLGRQLPIEVAFAKKLRADYIPGMLATILFIILFPCFKN
jgi:hypothetical protein